MNLTREHDDWCRMVAHSMRRRWPGVPFEELHQEALIRLWRLLEVYDPRLNDSWKGFAHKTVYQHLWKRCEQWSRWTKRNTTGHEKTPDIGAWDAAPQADDSGPMQRLLLLLSDKHRHVIEQVTINGRTLEDVAAESFVSIAYVHQLHSTALVELRRLARYMGVPGCIQQETTQLHGSEPSEIMSDSAAQLSLFATKKG